LAPVVLLHPQMGLHVLFSSCFLPNSGAFRPFPLCWCGQGCACCLRCLSITRTFPSRRSFHSAWRIFFFTGFL
jgi:hypothetical protein